MTKTSFQGRIEAGLGALVLGLLTLAPTDGDNGSVSMTNGLVCIGRDFTGTISANTGTYKTVCNAGETALAGWGECPHSGNLSGLSANITSLDRTVWLYCSASGTAHWQATCCNGM